MRLLAPELRARHGGARELASNARSVRGLVDELGARVDQDLRVLVNGRAIALLDGMETLIGDDDVVSLYYAGIRGFPGG